MSKTAEPSIQCSVEDRGRQGTIATVTVDNPLRLNILNTPLITQLIEAVDALSQDARLRVVILTGAGERAFIGGADIREMAGLDRTTASAFIARLHRACLALRSLRVPVIARIRGYCLGAGLEIAASCDLRAAAAGSSFGMPEVKVGVPSVIEAALLPRLVGRGKARELVLTGESISAEEALQCGLVQKVVAPGDLDKAVEDWVGSILSAGPEAIRLQKTLLRQWENLPLDEAIERGIETFAEAYHTDEPRLLMQRFLDRKRS